MATLKQLIECEISDFFAGFGHPGEPETPEEMQSQLLARVIPLLAGLEQEPVAYMHRNGVSLMWAGDLDAKFKVKQGGWSPLYAAPQLPQPAVGDGRAEFEVWMLKKWGGAERQEYDFVMGKFQHGDNYADSYTRHMWKAWLASRAAMLQGAESVSQPDELPLDYLQGHKDGLEWAARLAEANHPQTGDWLYDDPLELAKAIRKGPDMPTAPVQGWIPCSERMPEEIGRYWCYVEEQNCLGKSHYQWNCSWNGGRWWVESENGGRVTHWMPLSAAPQQEVKSGR